MSQFIEPLLLECLIGRDEGDPSRHGSDVGVKRVDAAVDYCNFEHSLGENEIFHHERTVKGTRFTETFSPSPFQHHRGATNRLLVTSPGKSMCFPTGVSVSVFT